jgi:hypothetical protein
MIDFEQLVENLLFSVNEAGEATTTEIEKATVEEFFKNFPQAYTDLQAAFKTKYKDSFPFPNLQEFLNIAYTAVNSYSRNTKDAKKYANLMNYFPLLDLFAELYQELKGASGGSVARAEEITNKFIERLKNFGSDIPMDYIPNIQWARDVKADYYTSSKQDFGKARLDSIQPKNLGIYATILYLLAIRRNMLKPKVPVDRIPPANEMIKSIFFDPQSYIQGKKPMPDEKVKLIYTDTTCELLLRVARAAYELFDQQKTSILGDDPKLNQNIYNAFMGDETKAPALPLSWNDFVIGESVYGFDKSYELLVEKLLKLNEKRSNISEIHPFIFPGKKEIKDGNRWNEFLDKANFDDIQETTPPKEQAAKYPQFAFTLTYSNGLKDNSPAVLQVTKTSIEELEDEISINLKENYPDYVNFTKKFEGPNALSDAIKFAGMPSNGVESDESTYFNSTDLSEDLLVAQLGEEIIRRSFSNKTPEKEVTNDPGSLRPFEIKTDVFEYSLDLIKKHERDVPQAGNLYAALMELADFIQKEQKMDWQGLMSDIKNIAQGLNLGVPDVGGKRA